MRNGVSNGQKINICPRCKRVLDYTSSNFGPRPGRLDKLDRVCKLCRSEIATKAQHDTNDHIHEARKKLVNNFQR